MVGYGNTANNQGTGKKGVFVFPREEDFLHHIPGGGGGGILRWLIKPISALKVLGQ